MLLSGLCIPLLTPLHPACLSFISLLSFLTPSVPPSLYLSCSRSSFFARSPLSAAVTDSFLPRLKYEYFRAKELKGNNEMAPKLNYPPFPESQKRDFPEWWAHWCHVGVSFTSSHTDKLVVSCVNAVSVIFPLILLPEWLKHLYVVIITMFRVHDVNTHRLGKILGKFLRASGGGGLMWMFLGAVYFRALLTK